MARRYTITEAENSFYTTKYRDAIKQSGNKKVGYSTGNFASLFPNSPVLNKQTFDNRSGIIPSTLATSTFKYNDQNVIEIFKNVSDQPTKITSPDFVGTDSAALNFQNKPVFDINEPIKVSDFNSGGYDKPLHGSPNLSTPDINNLPNYEKESSATEGKKLNSKDYYYKGNLENTKGTVDIKSSGGYGHRSISNNTNEDTSDTLGKYFSKRSRSPDTDLPTSLGTSYKNSNNTQT